MLEAHRVDVSELEAVAERDARGGATPMYVAADGTALGVISVADTFKDESVQAVAQLGALGLQVWMLTGDNALTAAAIA